MTPTTHLSNYLKDRFVDVERLSDPHTFEGSLASSSLAEMRGAIDLAHAFGAITRKAYGDLVVALMDLQVMQGGTPLPTNRVEKYPPAFLHFKTLADNLTSV